MRKPFFRKQTKSWYVKDADGNMIRLGKSRDESFDAWHKLESTGAVPRATGDATTIGYVVGEFLEWTKDRRELSTYEWYRNYLLKFVDYVREERPVSDLKPLDLEHWIHRTYKTASENGRLGAKRAILRALNWAVKKRVIKENPLTGAEIAATDGSKRTASYQPRRSYLSPEQWQKLIGEIPAGDWLHDYLNFLRETGCRPHEARILDASRHFVRELGMIVIPKDEAKGRKRERVIPLNDAALAIVQRLALKRPTGRLFQNKGGSPVTRNMIHGRLHTLSKRIGFHVHAYMLRRSFITDGLSNGLTADVLKTVVGHASTAMIDHVYSALERKAEFLRDVARQARKGIA